MQPTDHALAIDRATQALYATASESYQPRAVKAIVAMIIVTVVLLGMLPVIASSMRPSGDESPASTAQSTASPAVEQVAPGTPVSYESP